MHSIPLKGVRLFTLVILSTVSIPNAANTLTSFSALLGSVHSIRLLSETLQCKVDLT